MWRSWRSARMSSIRIISPSGCRRYKSGCARASTRRSSPSTADANANAAARFPTPRGPCRRYACAPPSDRAAVSNRTASGCSGTDAKGPIHLLGEVVGRSGSVEDDDPLREAGRELPVAVGCALPKVVSLALEPVVVPLDARRNLARVELEQKRAVG